MEGNVPGIVLALGAAALGGPDALRVLLVLAGQSLVVDIAICVFVLSIFTALLLGITVLVRFVRNPRAGVRRARRAPATDLLAEMTLTVSVGVAFVVTACLVALPSGGPMSSVRRAFDSAMRSPAFAAGFLVLRCVVIPLLRVWRQARNAGGAVVPAGGERFGKLTEMVFLVVVVVVCIALAGVIQYAYAPSAYKSDGWKHACSA